MSKPLSLDAYRHNGVVTERVVVFNNSYLNARFIAYCPICEKDRLHDPLDEERQCTSCDCIHKDTDLGTVTWMQYVNESPKWVKF